MPSYPGVADGDGEGVGLFGAGLGDLPGSGGIVAEGFGPIVGCGVERGVPDGDGVGPPAGVEVGFGVGHPAITVHGAWAWTTACDANSIRLMPPATMYLMRPRMRLPAIRP